MWRAAVSPNLNSISPFTNCETTSTALIMLIIPLTKLREFNWIIDRFFLFDSFYNPSLQCNPLWNVKASFTENFCYKHWSASRKCWSSACMSTQALWAHSSSNADLKVYLVKMSAVKWILVFFLCSVLTCLCPAFYLIYTNVLCLDYCTVNNKYFN